MFECLNVLHLMVAVFCSRRRRSSIINIVIVVVVVVVEFTTERIDHKHRRATPNVGKTHPRKRKAALSMLRAGMLE